MVDPEREALDRFTLELERAERLPPLPPRRCASAIAGRIIIAPCDTSRRYAMSL